MRAPGRLGRRFPLRYTAVSYVVARLAILLSSYMRLHRYNHYFPGVLPFLRYDFKNPGSQADGSFLGVTDELKGMANGYPGGKWFDPMGLSRGTEKQLKHYQWAEIRNGRLAMVSTWRSSNFFSYLAWHAACLLRARTLLAAVLYRRTWSRLRISIPFITAYRCPFSWLPLPVLRPCAVSNSLASCRGRPRSSPYMHPAVAWLIFRCPCWATGPSTSPPARAPCRT